MLPTVHHYSLHYRHATLTSYITFTLRPNSVLSGQPMLHFPTALTPFYVENLLSSYLRSECTTSISSLLFTFPPCDMDILHYIYPQHYLHSTWTTYFPDYLHSTWATYTSSLLFTLLPCYVDFIHNIYPSPYLHSTRITYTSHIISILHSKTILYHCSPHNYILHENRKRHSIKTRIN